MVSVKIIILNPTRHNSWILNIGWIEIFTSGSDHCHIQTCRRSQNRNILRFRWQVVLIGEWAFLSRSASNPLGIPKLKVLTLNSMGSVLLWFHNTVIQESSYWRHIQRCNDQSCIAVMS